MEVGTTGPEEQPDITISRQKAGIILRILLLGELAFEEHSFLIFAILQQTWENRQDRVGFDELFQTRY